jgi:hypothetical protein
MSHRVVAPDSGKSRFLQLLPSYTMWGYLYPGTDATGTVRGLATPTPPQAKSACANELLIQALRRVDKRPLSYRK